jgi:hypothetical protein
MQPHTCQLCFPHAVHLLVQVKQQVPPCPTPSPPCCHALNHMCQLVARACCQKPNKGNSKRCKCAATPASSASRMPSTSLCRSNSSWALRHRDYDVSLYSNSVQCPHSSQITRQLHTMPAHLPALLPACHPLPCAGQTAGATMSHTLTSQLSCIVSHVLVCCDSREAAEQMHGRQL